MFWVPQSGRLGLGISILSYAGEVLLGVATDAGLVPDPEKIVEGFHKEFEALKKKVSRLKSVAGNATPTRMSVNELKIKLSELSKTVEGIAAEREAKMNERCKGITK
jgi:hypothetical protein